ncbi:MAG: hypothetical protein AAGK77_14205 [Pseudomonadota bacterium]
MQAWEYKVVPAPYKGQKSKGVKGPEARFAHAVEGVLNDMAAEGWEYQRADTLPSLERAGLTKSTTEWRNLLVFRRPLSGVLAETPPDLLPPPATAEEEAVKNASETLDRIVENADSEAPADPDASPTEPPKS